VLRRRAALDWWIGRAMPVEDVQDRPGADRRRIIAALVLLEGWSADRIAGSFDGGTYRPEQLTDIERAMAKALEGNTLHSPDQPEWVRLEFPEWLGDSLHRIFGERLEPEMQALLTEAPLDLRANTLKAGRDDAMAALARDGVEAKPTELSPLGLRVDGRPPLATCRRSRTASSKCRTRLAARALLVDARPGLRIVDFCAGAGGKTLAMAAAMENKGRIVACDVLQGRVDRAAVRLQRAGVHNVERRGLSSERDPWVKRHAGAYDRVLVDAPCTGVGTWRRNPDARWKLTPDYLKELLDLQQRIFDSAARLVKPGGRLIYATCSLLPEENEAQIDSFLAQHADFAVLLVADVWREAMAKQPNAAPCPSGGSYLRLTPAQQGTDGFFVAILQRNAAPSRLRAAPLRRRRRMPPEANVRVRIRRARPEDARGIAAVHVESWRSAYAGILPDRVMVQMSVDQKAVSWRRQIETTANSQGLLVAELPEGGIAGFASCGRPTSALAGFDGEIFMLYVMPDWQEQGLGRGLLCGSLQLMAKNGCSSALVWVLADNPARFFYEAMEGKRVGEKDEAIWGVTLHQIAYGWRSLSPLPAACRGRRRP
jgi:16S rRNA (cytosine967-C5)-methyltransferase